MDTTLGIALACLCAAAGCSDAGSALPDGASAPDLAAIDLARGTDGGVAAVCGDGRVDPGEACDPGAPAANCAMLAGSFGGGSAPCRATCTGWDVSACTRAGSGPERERVRPRRRDGTRWASALCNEYSTLPLDDPSSPLGDFSFSVQLAAPGSANAKVWRVSLQGGGYCDGLGKPCTDRARSLVSAWDDGAQAPLGADGSLAPGGGDTVSGAFAGANLIDAEYCSSDLWSGTRDAAVPVMVDGITSGAAHASQPFTFTGRRNVRAILELLIQRYGLDPDDPATQVLLTGESAGGHGVNNNADQAASLLPKLAADGRAKFAPCAGWVVAPSDASYDATYQQFLTEPNPLCHDAMALEGLPPSLCLSSATYPFSVDPPDPQGRPGHGGLGLRFFVMQNRTDQLYMKDAGIPFETAPYSDLPQARADWLDAMNQSMALVPGMNGTLVAAHPIAWLYAPADGQYTGEKENLHGTQDIATLDPWTKVTADGAAGYQSAPNTVSASSSISYDDLLDRFWSSAAGDPGVQIVFRDDHFRPQP